VIIGVDGAFAYFRTFAAGQVRRQQSMTGRE
jgi:hypothetical protein